MTLALLGTLLAGLLAAGCLAALFWQRYRMRRTMETLHRMLDAAMDGSFVQRSFDESLLSSVESKLNAYLSASEVSARNLALEKDKIKQLIADISHQTKTPIANILLYAQLLAEQPLSPQGVQCVQALDAQAQKLGFLIASLVKLSRLEAGILALRPALCPLAPILDAVAAQYAPKAAEKQMALEVAPTGAQALCDAKWTQEALANLVDNAIKYTPRGGRVCICVQRYDLFCRVDVADTGPGIAPDEQAKIFGRFYRSQSVSDSEGVGIGLYLARQILAGQGGYLKVACTPGQGAVFSAFLPREAHVEPAETPGEA